jgi:hypothetical protein
MIKKTTEFFMEIKRHGYTRSQDNLGLYFDKGEKRFSCMKHGHMFICYFNKKVNNEWNLQSKSTEFSNVENALRWILIQVQLNNS